MAVAHLFLCDMRIASWNVNSLKIRLELVLEYCQSDQIDCLLLQELKQQDENFPHDAFNNIGWKSVCHGQKTYNGVAILSRYEIKDVMRGLPLLEGDQADEQSRYIEASVKDFRVASIYLPNGNPCPGPKFDYKLSWMRRLTHHARQLLKSENPILLGGDYNVIPQPIDCYSLANFASDALYHPASRAAFFEMSHSGYIDAIRAIYPNGAQYSYWDYQGGAWDRDNGIRIDHLMLSPEAADKLVNAGINKSPRGRERPSDHTPVWAEFSD